MSVAPGSLLGRVALHFDRKADHVPGALSAAARGRDGALWLAADERATLEVLRPMGAHAHELGKHRSYPLGEALELGDDDEADIEGLAVEDDGKGLWLVGSHSAVRKKPKKGSGRRDLARLGDVEAAPARFSLARVAIDHHAPKTRGRDEQPRVARLPRKGDGSLLDVLAHDDHLGAFLPRRAKGKGKHLDPIPGKDNGFDIEGLALHEDRLLLGLRGPVLRGYAFVLELELERRGKHLELRKLGERRYRKHALDLDGLGVRELVVRGKDVLILAGPTMTLDGAHRLFRWRGPRGKGDTIVGRGKRELEPLFDLPWGPGVDHAEGIARFDWFDDDDSILVVYDAPGKQRRLGKSCVLADVFAVD
jgi:hypothetical protein